jgi:hypothetical protein
MAFPGLTHQERSFGGEGLQVTRDFLMKRVKPLDWIRKKVVRHPSLEE